MRDHIAEKTHPIVERIVAAGGIVHARTTTPEYSCAGFTHSKVWGITRNPWNLEYGPRRSFGGSAAALAAGTTTLATGSDIGGSIRIPASFSGVFGYRPPYGRVPALPPYNLDHYCHDGPLARSVADCILLENVISGPHPTDIVSLKPDISLPQEYGDIQDTRIALSVTLGDFIVDPDVEESIRAAAEALRQAGAIVEEVESKWRKDDIFRAADIHHGTLFGSAVRRMFLVR
jgi:Asp-tRNA(Asn)/Glu-tRNA(Gln) amidotransferase A subunit family amidase